VKIHVDMDTCDVHGQCVFAAPEVFELDDIGDLSYKDEADDGLRAKVETAVRLCPVQAINIVS
jgi:ferredoxin